MSTMKEILESKVSISVYGKQSIIKSFVNNFITFSMLAFCIYISQGSTWWTFLTGLIFLIFLWGRLCDFVENRVTTFKNKEAAIEYLKNLDL